MFVAPYVVGQFLEPEGITDYDFILAVRPAHCSQESSHS